MQKIENRAGTDDRRPRLRIAARGAACALAILLVSATVAETPPGSKPEEAGETGDGAHRAMTFESYKERHVRRFAGRWLVEGDIRRTSEDEVFQDYLRFVGVTSKALLDVDDDGLDNNYDVHRKLNLSYCFGHLFPDGNIWSGTSPEEFMAAFETATREWERAADVNFIHLSQFDSIDSDPYNHGKCRPDVEDVYFRVQLNGPGGIAGSAFFPDEDDPEERYVTFGVSYLGAASLYRTMLHELGHVLGLRHEHARHEQDGGPGQAPCLESPDGRPLTPVDGSSVMFYDYCDGVGSQSGHLSNLDRLGLSYVYNLPRSQKISYDPQVPTDIFWYRPGETSYEVWYGLSQETFVPIDFQKQAVCYAGTDPCGRQEMPRKALPFPASDYGTHDTSVMLYGRGETVDSMLQPAPGWPPFTEVAKVVTGHYAPVVAKLHGIAAPYNNPDDILWYSTADKPSFLWHATGPGTHSSHVQSHADYARPLVGAFTGPDAWSHPVDVFWFASDSSTSTLFHSHGGADPHHASTYKVDVGKCGVSHKREYIPLVGEFDGDDEDEVLWYGPGDEPDVLWLSLALCHEGDQRVNLEIEGDYKPFVGDFDGNGLDDVFFYSQGAAVDTLWSMTGGGEFESHTYWVDGDYAPLPADFNGDGCTDVLWFAPHRATSPLWRSYCTAGLFVDEGAVTHPTNAYPVGYGPGHGRQPIN